MMPDLWALDVDTVRQWAEDTLAEWMIGYTDYDEGVGDQCRIQRVGDALYEVVPANSRGVVPRRFLITIHAKEVG